MATWGPVPSVRTPRVSSLLGGGDYEDGDMEPLIEDATSDEENASSALVDNRIDFRMVNLRQYRYHALATLGLLTLAGVASVTYSIHSPNPHATANANAQTLAQFAPVKTQCGQYGGIDHPYAAKCCDASCGSKCGDKDCWKASGGAKACCSSFVGKYCSIAGKAPCMLGAIPAADQCQLFGGRMHPGQKKCCGALCGGLCGTTNCEHGDGGALSCCKETAGLPTCSPTSGVPCALILTKDVFSGVMQLTVDDLSAFLNNERSRAAAHDALATRLAILHDQVTITGIGVYNGGTIASVGYKIESPIGDELTAEKIRASSSEMPATLNYALSSHGVPAFVSKVVMVPPAVVHRHPMTTTLTTVITTVTTTTPSPLTTVTTLFPQYLEIFTGIVTLNVDDPTEFLSNPASKVACLEGLTQAFEVTTNEVTITGLYAGSTGGEAIAGRREDGRKLAEDMGDLVVGAGFSIGYKLIVPGTTLTSAKISQKGDAVRLSLAAAMAKHFVKVKISDVEVPAPFSEQHEIAPQVPPIGWSAKDEEGPPDGWSAKDETRPPEGWSAKDEEPAKKYAGKRAPGNRAP